MLSGTVGMVPSVAAALGEEIGWRGFLVPELARVLPFTGVAVVSGLVWAAWHYPITAMVYRDAGLPAWFWLLTFTASIHTIVAHSFAAIAAVSAIAESDDDKVRSLLLLAPACSLSRVLDRWAAQRGIPRRLVTHIRREVERLDGMPVSHWDVRTLGLPGSVRVRILHDPTDDVVPVLDSYMTAAHISADIDQAVAGTGHYKILGSDDMRTALTACLQPTLSR